MPEIDINTTPAKITSPASIGGAVSWLQQGVQFVNSINQLINSIGTLRNTLGPGSQIEVISPKGQSSPGVSQKIDLPKTEKKPKSQGYNDQDLAQFFSSPAGLQKIAEAIDAIIPLTGDVKLSELKNGLANILPGDQKPQKQQPKGEKDGAQSKK